PTGSRPTSPASLRPSSGSKTIACSYAWPCRRLEHVLVSHRPQWRATCRRGRAGRDRAAAAVDHHPRPTMVSTGLVRVPAGRDLFRGARPTLPAADARDDLLLLEGRGLDRRVDPIPDQPRGPGHRALALSRLPPLSGARDRLDLPRDLQP